MSNPRDSNYFKVSSESQPCFRRGGEERTGTHTPVCFLYPYSLRETETGNLGRASAAYTPVGLGDWARGSLGRTEGGDTVGCCHSPTPDLLLSHHKVTP